MLCCVVSLNCFSQKHHLIDLELQAEEYFQDYEFKKALEVYFELETINDTLIGPEESFNMGVCFLETYQYQKALRYLERAHDDNGHHHYYYAKALQLNYHLDSAIKQYESYKAVLEYEGVTDSSLLLEVEREIGYCVNAKVKIKNPVEAEISLLLSDVNSEYDDYSPLIDEKKGVIYFTSDRYEKGEKAKHAHDGTFADKVYQNGLNDSVNIKSELINAFVSKHDMACVALSHSGNKMILFKSHKSNALNHSGGHLYLSNRKFGKWQEPELFDALTSSKSTEISACFSANDSVVYFSSDMPGGFGGEDIYRTELNSKGKWSQPENLGENINTDLDEDSPFMHANGEIFYFASQGWGSMGGYDFYQSTISENEFSKPINLGYPINTVSDDFGLYVTNNGDIYFADNRSWGVGETDVYKAKFRAKEDEVVIKGRVEDGSDLRHSYKVSIKVDGKIVKVIATDEVTEEFVFFMPQSLDKTVLIVSKSDEVHKKVGLDLQQYSLDEPLLIKL